jgi:hypothetical protein
MLDAYSLRARVMPAVLVCIPALVLFVASFVSLDDASTLVSLFGAIAAAIVSGIVRERGSRLEPALWASWGGSPTIRRLRWRDNPAAQVGPLHDRIDTLFDAPLPTPDEEEADPAAADARYKEAVAVLREQTRSRDDYPLVADENAEYGFRRNSLGLRLFGLAVAGLVAAASIVLFVLGAGSVGRRLVAYGIPFATAVLCFAFWLRMVSPAWVRTPAERYAERLLGAVQLLTRA